MRARIYHDSEGEQWFVADDDQKYVDGPLIDIPDDLGQAMRDVKDQLTVASKAFAEWVEKHIEANGGEDYRDFITGAISESAYQARAAGCDHANAETIGKSFPRTECRDCGRRHYPERWL